MRAAIDLNMWATPIRVLSEVPGAADILRDELYDHVSEEPAPVGFVLKAPSDQRGMHLLVDRSGLIVARARSWEECLPTLAGHLSSFSPPRPGTIRLRMTAISRPAGGGREAVLAVFPLLRTRPLVERQLERASLAVVDRMAIDVDESGIMATSPSPWPGLTTRVPGHDATAAIGLPVSELLLPGADGIRWTRAATVRTILSSVATGGMEESWQLADRLALLARPVPLDGDAVRELHRT